MEDGGWRAGPNGAAILHPLSAPAPWRQRQGPARPHGRGGGRGAGRNIGVVPRAPHDAMTDTDRAGLLGSLSDALAATVDAAAPGVLRVEARRRGHASGIAWSADGLVVTAHHAVQREHDLRVGLPDGEAVPARFV